MLNIFLIVRNVDVVIGVQSGSEAGFARFDMAVHPIFSADQSSGDGRGINLGKHGRGAGVDEIFFQSNEAIR